jgi:hypothetical protein
VTIRAVKTENVEDGLSVGGENDLADTQERFALGNVQKIRGARIGRGSAYFFARWLPARRQ